MRWEVHSWDEEAIRFYERLERASDNTDAVMRVKEKDLVILAKTNLSSKRR